MKLYIGPYKCRWYARNLEKTWIEYSHKKNYYEVEDHELTKTDKFVGWVCDKFQFVLDNTINLYIMRDNRKTNIKLHDYDSWNVDHTLALIIVPLLKQLRDTKHGSGFIEPEDLPEHLRPKADEPDTETNNVELRWNWALDEMILAFEAELDDTWEDKYISGLMDYTWVKDAHGNSEQVRGPNHTYHIDMEGMKAEADRYTNGRILFAKYYKGLWD